MSADIGTTATVTFPDPTAFPLEINSISIDGAERVVIDAAYLALAANKGRPKIFGKLYEPGTVTLVCHVDQDAIEPPGLYDGATGTLEITFPSKGGGAGATMSAAAQVVSAPVTVPLEDKMEVTVTFQLSGDVTWVDEV
jgi:hypothetical protein